MKEKDHEVYESNKGKDNAKMHIKERHGMPAEDRMQKRNKTKIYLIAAAIALVLTAAALFLIPYLSNGCEGDVCSSISGHAVNIGKGDVVAEFDGGKIYSDQFDKTYDMFFFMQGIPKSYSSSVPKAKILNQTIMQELLYDKASDNGFDATAEETEKQLEKTLADKGMSLEEFKSQFENESFDYDFFMEYNRKILSIGEFLNSTIFSKISVDEQDASDYYNSNKDKFHVDAQIKASHILVNTSSEAQDIIAELDAGKDFAELAKERSIDPSASSNAGDLGYFSKGMMVPEFEAAAFALENIGDYTKEPVKTQYGYHVIKLTGKQDARDLSFAEIKEQIEGGLLQQKQSEAMAAYTHDLLENAGIKIYLKEETSSVSASTEATVQKSSRPDVELFVMAYCPYGTQIEKGILPVAELLGDKIEFQVKFVNYAMHGEKEIKENTLQYCMQKEQDSKYLDYLACFLKDGDSARCLEEVGVDTDALNSCMKETDEKFSITENLKNKQGNYPAFLIHNADNKKYGVRGSPTLVINGATLSAGRDPASLLKTVCSAFQESPDECNEQLPSEKPSPGFGYGAAQASTQEGCEG